MKKGIVGLILGAFFIALFAPPVFANPGPPNPNAPSQNIKDISSSAGEDPWGEVKAYSPAIRTQIIPEGRSIGLINSTDIRIGFIWHYLISLFGGRQTGTSIGKIHETNRNCVPVGNSN